MRKRLQGLAALFSLAAASTLGPAGAQTPPAAPASSPAYPQYHEPWRPQFHYSQPSLFMNDPNGLVHENGEWHLFYQSRPGGAIVWGHAVSKDLVHWQNLPVAIPAQPDRKSIFSGSVVIDDQNTSGFGTKDHPAMVAIYTASGAGSQTQNLAYSLDHGRTFTFYSGNPVIDIGESQFRDPNVFWYAASRRWVMVVSNPNDHQVSIYSSADLKKWDLQSKWGPLPPTGGQYECPALFPLQVDGKPGKTRWVMVISTNPGGLWGGSQTAAYIGDFDGKRFKEDARYRYDGPPGTTDFESFEAGYGRWSATGTAFGAAPQKPAIGAAFGFQGSAMASSLGVEGAGELTSPSFTIGKRYINFLLGGSVPHAARGATAPPAKVSIDLMVNGSVVRSAPAAGASALDWVSWDVGDLKGQEAHLRITDQSPAAATGIAVDRIGFSDTAALPGNARTPWFDWGKDDYAGITFNNAPNGRRLFVGWLSNWQYAQSNTVPTTPWWRGQQSEPRELSLRTVDGRSELFQTPIPELAQLRAPKPYSMPARSISGSLPIGASGEVLDIELSLTNNNASAFGLKVLTGANGDETVIGYNAKTGEVYIDRSKSGTASAALSGFDGVHSAPLKLRAGKLDLRILVDKSIIEVFANGGERVLTDLVYPTQGSTGLSLFATSGSARLGGLRVYTMRSIWP